MVVTVADLYIVGKTKSYSDELIREDKTRGIILQIFLRVTAGKELILLYVLFLREIITSTSRRS